MADKTRPCQPKVKGTHAHQMWPPRTLWFVCQPALDPEQMPRIKFEAQGQGEGQVAAQPRPALRATAVCVCT